MQWIRFCYVNPISSNESVLVLIHSLVVIVNMLWVLHEEGLNKEVLALHIFKEVRTYLMLLVFWTIYDPLTFYNGKETSNTKIKIW